MTVPVAPRLLLEHRDAIFAYILALVRDWNAAEDVFQEVSIVVLQKGQEGQQVETFLPWCREIARRTVLHHRKTSARSRLVLSPEAIDAVDRAFAERDLEVEGHGRDLLQALRRCLQKLPDPLRRLVRLRYDDALSLEDVARRLGRTPGAVQVALSRIRMKLQDCTRRSLSEQPA